MKNDKRGVYANIGSSSHSKTKRTTNDYYATSPQAITLLHKHHLLDKNTPYWECAVGGGEFKQRTKTIRIQSGTRN